MTGGMRKLLWIDCIAAALVGVAVLTFSSGLSRIQALPRELLLFLGAANLLYAGNSFRLAMSTMPQRRDIQALVVANAAWTVVCVH